LKRVLRGLAVMAGVLLAVLAAWVASNLVDAAPQPLPAALQPAPVTLPPERNAFFTLLGLRAPGNADPAHRGRQRWAQGELGEETAGIAVPSGAPFDCENSGDDCAADWLAHAAELQAQLGRYAELGARCTALSRGMAFEEVLPPEGDARWGHGMAGSHVANASLCSRWLLAHAVMAAARGEPQAAAAAFDTVDRFDRALLEGSRSLVGNAVGWAVLRREWRAAATVVAADPRMAAVMQPLEAPLPLSVREASHWIPAEAAFQRAMMDQMPAHCEQPGTSGALARWLCRTRIGVLPNVSKADIDAYWLQALNATREGLAPALNQPPFARQDSVWRFLAWRNTFARLLFAIGADGQGGYVARQADLLMHHQVFGLAMSMARERVAPQARAAWLAAKPLDPALRARLHLDGDQLVAEDWSAAHGAQQPRYRIRIPLPRA
jgi:hypothetical protein